MMKKQIVSNIILKHFTHTPSSMKIIRDPANDNDILVLLQLNSPLAPIK